MPQQNFGEYWDSLTVDGRKKLAQKSHTGWRVLHQYARGYRLIGIEVAVRLLQADRKITLPMLRPDLYGGNDETVNQRSGGQVEEPANQ